MQTHAERLQGLSAELHPPYNWQEFRRRERARKQALRLWSDPRYLAVAAAVLVVFCAFAFRAATGARGGWLALMRGQPQVSQQLGAQEDGWQQSGERQGGVQQAGQRQGAVSQQGSAARNTGVDSGTKVGGQSHTDNLLGYDDLKQLASNSSSAPTEYGTDELAAAESATASMKARAMESWLATLPKEPVVVRVGTRAAVARLEDRIAQVDDLLSVVRLGGARPDRLAALQRERARLVGSLAQVRYAEVVAAEYP